MIESPPPLSELIYLIRGQRVMLDSDLAALYGVPTKYLNQAVNRNPLRFPRDFAFTLSSEDSAALRLQIATSKTGRGGRRYLVRAFTEHGVAMLSSVLHSPKAIRLDVEIIRAFIRLRQALAASRELADRLAQAEKKLSRHEATLGEHASAIKTVFEDIRRLMEPAPEVETGEEPKRRIGFSPG